MATKSWFANSLSALGLAGLEDVFDYVQAMPPADAAVYLESLVGPSAEARAFLAAYVAKRASPAPAPAAPTASFSDTSAPRGRAAKKRGRGGRGGGRGGRGGRGARDGEASFAQAAAPPIVEPVVVKASARESSVERARAQVDDHRRRKKVVNCLACGYIERALGKDGACGFCGEAMFPISDGDGGSSGEAVAHKDRLLAYDRRGEKRTTVVEDGDRFVDADGDMWLSAEEREAEYAKRVAAEEKRTSRSFNITLDVAGRKVVAEAEPSDVDELADSVGNAAIGSDNRDYAMEDMEETLFGEVKVRSDVGDFYNPTLSGPSPRFTMREGEEGEKWLAAVTAEPKFGRKDKHPKAVPSL